ncbi:MAG: hypothetical protein C4554_07505 [Dethiobacter sp.]|jgi:opine dehydrogenase|nr:MAG: hypothetical protein C4554_07505 [Dethiobacter sp.]
MFNNPIAVLGGGNGAHMMAGDLMLAGHLVNFYEHPLFAEKFSTTLETKIIKVSGIGRTGDAKIHCVTTDMAEALKDVELVNVVIPASGHDLFFEEMIPHLVDGQVVIVWSGDFGSLRLAQLIKEKRPELKVMIAETNTLPYGTRLKGPAEVELLLTAPRVIIAAFPATQTEKIMEKLKPLFPALEPTASVLTAAFSNPNPICHPPGSLLNTGRIQYSGGNFYMYREGITEAVARVIRSVYNETAALAGALGYRVLEYEDRDFRTTCSIMGVAFQASFDTIGVIGDIIGPKSIQDRYITEDLPFGLVPMSQLGDWLGVPTPVIDAIINIGSVVCQDNFWESGRTLEKLGIAGLDREGIRKYVHEGVV